jgi:hypothetical protein
MEMPEGIIDGCPSGIEINLGNQLEMSRRNRSVSDCYPKERTG